jgi:hypothetical protein
LEKVKVIPTVRILAVNLGDCPGRRFSRRFRKFQWRCGKGSGLSVYLLGLDLTAGWPLNASGWTFVLAQKSGRLNLAEYMDII